MAKGGAFNVSQLIRELGLQTISGEDLRVLETIQPTLLVGDLSDVTPPHVAASAFFGVTLAGAVGLAGTVELQCLAPGGCFIEWVSIDSPVVAIAMRVTTVSLGVTTPLAAAGVTSRDPIVSRVRTDAVVLGPAFVSLAQTGDFFPMNPNPMFIPRASFFSLQHQVVNLTGTVGFAVREVPASEHVPA